MTTEQTLICPKCRTNIPLTQALAAQIEEKVKGQLEAEHQKQLQDILKDKEQLEQERLKFENDRKASEERINQQTETARKQLELEKAQLQQAKMAIEQEVAKRTLAERETIEQQKRQILAEREAIGQTVAQELEKEKQQLWQKAQEKAQESISLQLKDLESQNKEKEAKLLKAEEHELEMRKKMREIEEQKKNLDLELQRKLDEQKFKIVEQTKKESDEEHRMKLLEKEKQMEQMRKTIEDLKRKSEQGSTQIQGDVQENELKQLVKDNFPLDIIEDVPTGIRGGDLIQTVHSQFGVKCGVILWESKNTKSWANDWIKKSKEDQGLAKADLCIFVTRVMPEGTRYFTNLDGVWVCEYTHALALVSALRLVLLEIFNAKQASRGKNEKMEALYEYLSGSQFRNKIENIVIAFTGMKSDLESEKRAMMRIWKKREQEIEKVINNTAGMYGDLQGIIGAAVLPEVESLALPGGSDTLF